MHQLYILSNVSILPNPAFTPPDLHHRENNFSLPLVVFHMFMMSSGTSKRPVVGFGVTILLTCSLWARVILLGCSTIGTDQSSAPSAGSPMGAGTSACALAKQCDQDVTGHMGMSQNRVPQNVIFDVKKIGFGHPQRHPYFETSPYIIKMAGWKRELLDIWIITLGLCSDLFLTICSLRT